MTGGGADYSLVATAVPEVLGQAIDATRIPGTCGLIGAAPAGTEIPLDMHQFHFGHRLRGIIEGDAVPELFVPTLLDLWEQGRFPFDELITHYDFENVHEAIADMEAGGDQADPGHQFALIGSIPDKTVLYDGRVMNTHTMFRSDTVWEFSMADRMKFGPGAIEELGVEIANIGGDRVLVVTDSGVEDAGIAEEVIDSLPENAGCEVFAAVEPDPSVEVFERAGAFAIEFDPDIVIGVGGGSSIDTGKMSALLHAHGGEVLDYVAPPTGEGMAVPGPTTPYIAVPTTAGTGSETTPVAVVSVPERKLKVGVSDRELFPNLALVDPALTISLPAGPTAASGLDTLAHAIEGYTTRRFDAKARPETAAERPDYGGRTVLSDTLCRRAVELVVENLRRAVNNGEDLDARRGMSLASTIAALGFGEAGLGAAHALAYPVASEHHTPHGLTVALLLPAVMRFNATGAPERYAEIARILGKDVSGCDQREAAELAAEAVSELAEDVGIPDGLAAVGVEESELSTFAADTMELERLLVGNPRRVSEEDVERIFRQSL